MNCHEVRKNSRYPDNIEINVVSDKLENESFYFNVVVVARHMMVDWMLLYCTKNVTPLNNYFEASSDGRANQLKGKPNRFTNSWAVGRERRAGLVRCYGAGDAIALSQ